MQSGTMPKNTSIIQFLAAIQFRVVKRVNALKCVVHCGNLAKQKMDC